MSKYAVVVIGYNRINSISRLLKSLNNADYLGDEVTLIISIDKSNQNDVIEFVNQFEWKYGEKRVRAFEENQGLKKHMLSCGEYLDEFDAIIMLEDDIVVAPGFYNYAKKSVEFYKDNSDIAGISLYAHNWNLVANMPFQPTITNYDTYFIQYAQSWGQIWLKTQWKKFEKWYEKNKYIYDEAITCLFPESIQQWSAASWLKFHILYCVLDNKYFVYPYQSYTSCFSDVGQHAIDTITRYQLPLKMETDSNLDFAPFTKDSICYDVYLENLNLKNKFTFMNRTVEIDLYGTKDLSKITAPYLLSSRILDFKIIEKYALKMRPIEFNVLWEVEGEGIYLYDLTQKTTSNKERKWKREIRMYDYFLKERTLQYKEIVPFILSRIYNLYKRRMKK